MSQTNNDRTHAMDISEAVMQPALERRAALNEALCPMRRAENSILSNEVPTSPDEEQPSDNTTFAQSRAARHNFYIV